MTTTIRSFCTATLLLASALPAQAIVGGTDTPLFGHVDSGVQVTDSWVRWLTGADVLAGRRAARERATRAKAYSCSLPA